jgi:hypothetical protein
MAPRTPSKKTSARKTVRVAVKPKPKAAKPKRKASTTLKKLLAKDSVNGFVNRLPPPVKPLMKLIRTLIKSAAPEATELLRVGGPVYEANGIFARIKAKERGVLIEFLRGAELQTGGLQTAPAKNGVVKLSIASVKQLERSVLQSLVREAVALNLDRAAKSASGEKKN